MKLQFNGRQVVGYQVFKIRFHDRFRPSLNAGSYCIMCQFRKATTLHKGPSICRWNGHKHLIRFPEGFTLLVPSLIIRLETDELRIIAPLAWTVWTGLWWRTTL